MNLNYLYYDWTMLLLIPGMIFALIAQGAVRSAYNKYAKVRSSKGYTGAQVADIILREGLAEHVSVSVPGGFATAGSPAFGGGGDALSNHYDPRRKAIVLSNEVHNSTSLSAIGIAAHEAGHALQDAKGYLPIRVHRALMPVTRFASMAAFPIILLGMFLQSDIAIRVGVLAYGVVALYYLVTLPVEFNASRRALRLLSEHDLVVGEERKGVKKVLTAAAMTYVAAALGALLQVMRLMLLTGRRRR